jgi:acyl carrier protein
MTDRVFEFLEVPLIKPAWAKIGFIRGKKEMTETLRRRIYSAIRSVVNIDPATIDPSKNLREQVNLDSMQFVAVLAKLETEFNIELPISAMEANTFNDFLCVLESELEKSGSLKI